MRWSWLLVGTLVVGGAVACGSADSSSTAGCDEEADNCATVKDKRKPRASAGTTDIGLPEPARPEDQIDEPVASSTTTPLSDGGTPPPRADAGTSTTPTKPPPEPNKCYAGTLNQNLPDKACYQRRSDGMWFQCKGSEQLWYRNVVNGVGPFGACTEVHPLQ
jgi:hypothetical protein